MMLHMAYAYGMSQTPLPIGLHMVCCLRNKVICQIPLISSRFGLLWSDKVSKNHRAVYL